MFVADFRPRNRASRRCSIRHRPKGRDQRDKEPGSATWYGRRRSGEIEDVGLPREQSDRDHAADQKHFQRRDAHLHVAADSVHLDNSRPTKAGSSRSPAIVRIEFRAARRPARSATARCTTAPASRGESRPDRCKTPWRARRSKRFWQPRFASTRRGIPRRARRPPSGTHIRRRLRAKPPTIPHRSTRRTATALLRTPTPRTPCPAIRRLSPCRWAPERFRCRSPCP